MKVLYLIDTLEVGGAEQSLLNILQRFKKIEPVMCHIYPGEMLKPAFEAAGIRVISLNIPGRYNFRQGVVRVLPILRKECPDLLHTTLFKADVVGRITGRIVKIPIISSFVNESYHHDRWSSLSKLDCLKLKGVQLIDRFTARGVKHFVAVSESTRLENCHALGIPAEKVSVIYRGRNPEPFLKVNQTCSKQKLALNLPQETPIILNVARILRRKGQADLIRAMPKICQEIPQVKLLIAGEGPDRPLLEATIKKLNLENTVQLLGQQDNIPQLLQAANVFVFPSYYEGHPGSLIEAMLSARPIVASDIPAHHETLTNGESGRLVMVGNPEAIAQNCIWILNHQVEARNMGLRARQMALERFHIDLITAQYEKFYTEILP